MNLLMCPVCREALHLTEKTWSCVNKHSYDVAKQGYVNLHVVQHKHSKNPGDTVESVQARRAFLSAGFYAPLQHAVVTKIAELITYWILVAVRGITPMRCKLKSCNVSGLILRKMPYRWQRS